MKYNLVFIGNISIDRFYSCNTLGGGAFYSASSALIANNYDKKTAFYGSINHKTDLFKFSPFFIGTKTEKENTRFDYSCSQNECDIINLNSFSLRNLSFSTKHLHISIRKGIDDIELNKITYNTISVDITKSSVNNILNEIKKIKRINLLFCNYEEYRLVSTLKNVEKFIVTNSYKSVMVIDKEKIIYFIVPFLSNYYKSVGAGDSFIGGFLSDWSKNSELKECIISGVTCAHLSMLHKNQFVISNLKYKFLRNKYKDEIWELPKNILIVGSAGAGKTKFSKAFIEFNPTYKLIDDYDYLINAVDNDAENKIAKKLLIGFEILDYKLWDDVIDKMYDEAIQKENKLFELSRGTDQKYISGKQISTAEIYDYAIEHLSQSDRILVINLYSSYKLRKKRNIYRGAIGEHCVDNKTMSSIYRKSFIFSSKNIKRLKKKIPNLIEIINIPNNKKYDESDKFYFYVIQKITKKIKRRNCK